MASVVITFRMIRHRRKAVKRNGRSASQHKTMKLTLVVFISAGMVENSQNGDISDEAVSQKFQMEHTLHLYRAITLTKQYESVKSQSASVSTTKQVDALRQSSGKARYRGQGHSKGQTASQNSACQTQWSNDRQQKCGSVGKLVGISAQP